MAKSTEELLQQAVVIRDEKANKKNTALRVGTLFSDVIQKQDEDVTALDKSVEVNKDKLSLLGNNVFRTGSGGYLPWQAGKTYNDGDVVIAPDGQLVECIGGTTSTSEYDPGEWAATTVDEQSRKRDAKISNIASSSGYVVCQTGGSTAAKTITVDGITEITDKLRLLVQMNFANTATGTVTLNINNLGAKTLYYNGATVSAINTWETGEIVELYYANGAFQCFNAKGGSGNGGNMILEWNGDVATTRKQVKTKDRKAGMQISYFHPDNGWTNEQYIGSLTTDTEWTKDSNWSKLAKQSEIDAINDTLYSGEFVENFSLGDADKSFPFKAVIPSNQNFPKGISKFKISTDGLSDLYIANFRRGDGNKFALIDKYLAVWNDTAKCYTVDGFKYVDGCYVGFYVQAGTNFKGKNGVYPTYYIQNITGSIEDENSYLTFGQLEVYFAVNNVTAFRDIYEELNNKASKEDLQQTEDSLQQQITALENSDEEVIGVSEDEWDGLTAGGGASDAKYFEIPCGMNGVVTQLKFPSSINGTIYVSIKTLDGLWNSKTVMSDESKKELPYTIVDGIATVDCYLEIAKGQYIGITRKDGGVLKYKVAASPNWYYAFNAKIETKLSAPLTQIKKDIQSNTEQIETNNNEQNRTKKLKTFLSPCMLYFDNFTTDKKIKLFKDTGSAYEIQESDAWVDEQSSWEKGTEKELLSYIRPTATGEDNALKHQHTYTCDYRKHRYMIGLEALDTVFAVQTRNVSVGEGDVLFKVDFAQNKIYNGSSSKDITFKPKVGSIYWIEIFVLAFGSAISITSSDNAEESTELLVKGMITPSGKFGVYLHSGTPFKLYQYSVTTEGLNCDLYITGDSITKGAVYNLYNKRWASLVKERIPSTVISARGTSNFSDVLWRLTSEVEYLRPKILLSANGYNGGVSQKFIDALAKFCEERNIQYVQTMLTGGTPQTKLTDNKLYMQQNRQTVRFDIACRINYDLDNGMDYDKWPDHIHPNELGCVDLANRVFMDIPQLVQSYNMFPTDELSLY